MFDGKLQNKFSFKTVQNSFVLFEGNDRASAGLEFKARSGNSIFGFAEQSMDLLTPVQVLPEWCLQKTHSFELIERDEVCSANAGCPLSSFKMRQHLLGKNIKMLFQTFFQRVGTGLGDPAKS